VDLLQALSEIVIMTASRTLLGKEVRSKLNEGVADLYHDLDKGFTPINFLFPNLPLPSYRKRDEAHIKMRELFIDIINKRRESGDKVGLFLISPHDFKGGNDSKSLIE